MSIIKSIGFPRMHKEEGEHRDYLPNLFEELKDFEEIDIFIEENYGEGMGYCHKDYLDKNPRLTFISHDEIYKKDLILQLRAPDENELMLMNPKSALFSMLHYETRETRNKLLKHQNITCYSMDSVVDDANMRLIANYKGTSRTGSRVAFNELKNRMPNFYSQHRNPVNVTIIGMGAVAGNSARAFEELSDQEFLYDERTIPGLIIRMLPRNITKNLNILKDLISTTDILVDASKRSDASQIIIPNELIAFLPEHAIILDLTADPYNCISIPMQVKGVEGIPTGTLDKFIIEPKDEIYNTIPSGVETKNRRIVVSCNAWPGVDAEDCMKIYGEQTLPFLKLLLTKEITLSSINSRNFYERAITRSSLDYFIKINDKNY